jgi:hypothetical protein
MEGFKKWAVEMDSDDMTYIKGTIKIYFCIQILIGGIHRHTDNMVIL